MSPARLIGVAAGAAPPGWIAVKTFAALAAPGAPAPSLEGARRHHDAVRAALRRGPFLPAPFGRVWPSPQALAAALDSRADEIAAALNAMADCAEWSVRAPQAAATEGGRAYLKNQARQKSMHESLDALGAALQDEGLAVAWRRVGAAQRPSLALLLRPECEARALEELRQRFEADFSATPRVIGPWPPYSFTCLRGLCVKEAA